MVQGITIVETWREVRVDLASYQRDGRPLPAFCLPDELIEPIGRLVLAAYRERAAKWKEQS